MVKYVIYGRRGHYFVPSRRWDRWSAVSCDHELFHWQPQVFEAVADRIIPKNRLFSSQFLASDVQYLWHTPCDISSLDVMPSKI
jgi:hypothetical protein